MRRIVLFLFSNALFAISSFGQGALGVNTDGSTPHASAILDVKSTNQGVLIPRMSKADRDMISSPAQGLLIFQTDNTPGFYYYIGSAWTAIAGSSSSSGGASIIPISSGFPIPITTIAGGLPGNVAGVSFGNAANYSLTSGQIDISGGPDQNKSHAFTVPKSGTIKGISGFFSNTAGLSLIGTTITITATVYKASASSNIFSATPVTVTLNPVLTGIVLTGTCIAGTNSGLNLSVDAGDRLMVVYSASAQGVSMVNTISGYFSGGLTIE